MKDICDLAGSGITPVRAYSKFGPNLQVLGYTQTFLSYLNPLPMVRIDALDLSKVFNPP